MAHADLVRFSFAADLVQATFAVFLVMALYRLLRHVQPSMARAMVVFVVLQVGITCLNLVHQFGALMVATQSSYSSAFGEEGTDALVLLLMELSTTGTWSRRSSSACGCSRSACSPTAPGCSPVRWASS